MAIKIGVVAEDVSDVHVVNAIISKYLKANDFSVKHFVGQGCGKIKVKCKAWVDNLSKQGCGHVFVFHDLDRNDERELRAELLGKIKDCGLKNSLIVIPTEELEAWLLSDMDAIKSVFNIKTELKRIADVEAVKSPKEHLAKLIRKSSNKIYVNTVHNKKIAEKIEIEQLSRCESFKPFGLYLSERVVGA